MRCRVLLFAQLADALGERELTLDLPDDATVATALDELARANALIGEMRTHLAVAVDEAYVSESHRLSDGATLALISPVSGG